MIEVLLSYIHWQGKRVRIVNSDRVVLVNNAQIEQEKKMVYIALMTADTIDIMIPVGHKPRLGFATFDTRYFVDPKTQENMRESHLGNIVLKNGVEIT
jgi:hypothetical protein